MKLARGGDLSRGALTTALALFSATSSGCGDSLGPGEIAGTYVLQNVAGDALPAVLYTTEFSRIRVFADTLRFMITGRGSINTLRESQPLAPNGVAEPFRWQSGFSYKVVDDRIEVAFDCPPNASCVKPPHLVLHETRIGLRADFAIGARIPLQYRFVPGAE